MTWMQVETDGRRSGQDQGWQQWGFSPNSQTSNRWEWHWRDNQNHQRRRRQRRLRQWTNSSSNSNSSNATSDSAAEGISNESRPLVDSTLVLSSSGFHPSSTATTTMADQHPPRPTTYPGTTTLLWLVHLCYWLQQFRLRRRRQRRQEQRPPKVHLLTYRSLVERREVYRWWEAALSLVPLQPPHQSAAAEDRDADRTVWTWIARLWNNNSCFRQQTALWTRFRNFPLVHQCCQTSTTYTRHVLAIVVGACRRRGIWNRTVAVVRRCADLVATVNEMSGGVRALLVLGYNSHLLWACRSVEAVYASFATILPPMDTDTRPSSTAILWRIWIYLSLWVGVGMMATLLLAVLKYYALRIISRLTTLQTSTTTTDGGLPEWRIPPMTLQNDNIHMGNPNSSIRGEDWQNPPLPNLWLMDPRTSKRRQTFIRNSVVDISMSTITAAMTIVFHCRFSHVSIPLLPGLRSSQQWISPNLSIGAALLLLLILSTLHDPSFIHTDNNQAIRMTRSHVSAVGKTVGYGILAGFAFGKGGWDSFATTQSFYYWGNGCLCLTLLVTLLSLKAADPNAPWLRWCIVSFGCTKTGQVLVYDTDENQWIYDSVGFSLESTYLDDVDNEVGCTDSEDNAKFLNQIGSDSQVSDLSETKLQRNPAPNFFESQSNLEPDFAYKKSSLSPATNVRARRGTSSLLPIV